MLWHFLATVSFAPCSLRACAAARASARATAPLASTTPLAVDVAVIGGGPAGYTMAALLSGTHGHSVALVDPAPEGAWPNNYGSWRVEWECLARRLQMPELLSECVAREWAVTDCFFGGSWGMEWEQRTRLDRAYLQVDRAALKAALTRRFDGLVTVLPSKLPARRVGANLFEGGLAHDAAGSTLELADGTGVRASLVVDATGFESRLVARESDALASLWKPLAPGYQIACELAAARPPDGKGRERAASLTPSLLVVPRRCRRLQLRRDG